MYQPRPLDAGDRLGEEEHGDRGPGADAQRGEDLGQRRRHDHVAEDVEPRRAERAHESTLGSGTALAASRAVTRIWKKTMSVMSAIFGAWPRPSSTSSTGRKTTFGIG